MMKNGKGRMTIKNEEGNTDVGLEEEKENRARIMTLEIGGGDKLG